MKKNGDPPDNLIVVKPKGKKKDDVMANPVGPVNNLGKASFCSYMCIGGERVLIYVCLLGHALFSKVDIRVKDKDVTCNQEHYPLKVF